MQTPLKPHWLLRAALDNGLLETANCPQEPVLSTRQAWHSLLGRGLDTEALTRAVCDSYHMQRAFLQDSDDDAGRLIDIQTARALNVVPLYQDERTLTVATFDPFDLATEQTLRFISGRHIHFFIAPPQEIEDYLTSGAPYSIAGIVDDDGEEEEERETDAEEELGDSVPTVVRLANTIIIRAVAEHASDIHIEGRATQYVVRYRIDGVLQDKASLPKKLAGKMLSRIKVMAGIDAQRLFAPVDGRAKLRAGGRVIDLRLNIIPSVRGDKAVLRILDPLKRKGLGELALHDYEQVAFNRLLKSRMGVLLVTGPTGSGKTTTLYAALDALLNPEINVMTVEDPVEYLVEGITQVNINHAHGLTFGHALRAILRQDPDVILVGEIRDSETANIALEAGATGHLVLSTLHTNGALESILRLLELGVSRSLLTQALRGVVAQRLIRRLCPHCSDALNAQDIAGLPMAKIPDGAFLRKAVGCPSCNNTGYQGRIPILEILEFDQPIRQALESQKSTYDLHQLARKTGMKSLTDSALEHFYAGHTTLEEISRVVDPDMQEVPLKQTGGNKETTKSEFTAPVKILVVDDSEETRHLFGLILKRAGFELFEAEDGKQALELMQRKPVDMLITDLNMPQMNGLRLIREVRSLIEYAAIPIIVLTANMEEKTANKALRLGADDYLHKPVDADLLLERIQAVLKRTALTC